MNVHIPTSRASSPAALCCRAAAALLAVTLLGCDREEPPVIVEREVQPVIVARMPASDNATDDRTRGAQAPPVAAPDAPPATEGLSVNQAIDVAHAVTGQEPEAAGDRAAAAETSQPAQGLTDEPDPTGDTPEADGDGDVVVIGGAGEATKTLEPEGDVAVIGSTAQQAAADEPPQSASTASGAAPSPPNTASGEAAPGDAEAPAQGEGQGQQGLATSAMTAEEREAQAIDAVVADVEAAVSALDRDPQEAKDAFIREVKAQASDLRGRIARAAQRIGQLSPPAGSPGDRAKQQALFQLEQLRGRLDRATSRF